MITRRKSTTYYVCSYCKYQSKDKEDIEQCESEHKANLQKIKDYKIQDRVTFTKSLQEGYTAPEEGRIVKIEKEAMLVELEDESRMWVYVANEGLNKL